jgi:hypothetical protein
MEVSFAFFIILNWFIPGPFVVDRRRILAEQTASFYNQVGKRRHQGILKGELLLYH